MITLKFIFHLLITLLKIFSPSIILMSFSVFVLDCIQIVFKSNLNFVRPKSMNKQKNEK